VNSNVSRPVSAGQMLSIRGDSNASELFLLSLLTCGNVLLSLGGAILVQHQWADLELLKLALRVLRLILGVSWVKVRDIDHFRHIFAIGIPHEQFVHLVILERPRGIYEVPESNGTIG
jgi:hypothetical protein